MGDIEPFQICISDDDLHDLQERLKRSRIPEEISLNSGWKQGWFAFGRREIYVGWCRSAAMTNSHRRRCEPEVPCRSFGILEDFGKPFVASHYQRLIKINFGVFVLADSLIGGHTKLR
jgi:hypothetical protein